MRTAPRIGNALCKSEQYMGMYPTVLSLERLRRLCDPSVLVPANTGRTCPAHHFTVQWQVEGFETGYQDYPRQGLDLAAKVPRLITTLSRCSRDSLRTPTSEEMRHS